MQMNLNQKLLLIGGTGNVGRGICSQNSKYRKSFISSSRKNIPGHFQLDPFDKRDLLELIAAEEVGGVVLLHAVASPSECLDNIHSAIKTNVSLPARIAEICRYENVPFVFVSSEYIYNGNIGVPKSESSNNIEPANIYGLMKLSAEKLVQEVNIGALILRLPKMYSYFSENSILGWAIRDIQMLRSAPIANDQKFSPLASEDLAEILLTCVSMNINGAYNCGGPDALSRLDYYNILSRKFGYDNYFSGASLADMGIGPSVPRDVTLDSTKLYNTLGKVPRSFSSYIDQHDDLIREKFTSSSRS